MTIANPPTQAPAQERVFSVLGGAPLRGTVRIGGAKNAALPMLAATLLTADTMVLTNVPELADIYTMIDILRSLGAEVEWDRPAHRVSVKAADITTTAPPPELVNKMRASFLTAGPLLARFGSVDATTPGGCKLGARPVDVDVRGFRQMGADVLFTEQTVSAQANELRGAHIYMDYPSHTGTENLLMAAVLAAGKTRIVNASCEPEIVALGAMLKRMGARIEGLGTPMIMVEGVHHLHGVSEAILPDRLEAGTYAIGAVISGGEVTIENIHSFDMLPLTSKLQDAGADIWVEDNRMLARAGKSLQAVEVQTLPFPGFPTDLQAAFAVLMTQANGRSKLHERIFEDRLRYTEELVKMGASIQVERFGDRYGQKAEFKGPTPLHGADVRALDIRAGAGVVLAGLIAEGTSTIRDVFHIDRGYDRFVEKLRGLGASIEERYVPISG
ncbi:MAG: UDP-N-acetylglucosamine 1-carboxyvinyltransferase [Thermomicrobiales bacterium]|nr:UDP-N-acetylglucosamine 1-carboxyvinyltransferase [Thermomicrobiales bacterium]